MLQIIFIIIQLGFLIYITALAMAFLTGAPFVPSSSRTARVMIDLAKIKPGMNVYDLGSGDGRLLLLAAKAGAAKAVGYEINPLLVLWTKIRVRFSPYRRQIKVYWGNFWRANIADADIVFIYLLPWRMGELKAKLMGQMRQGTFIVSNSFIFQEWKITEQNQEEHVYVFQIPSMQAAKKLTRKL